MTKRRTSGPATTCRRHIDDSLEKLRTDRWIPVELHNATVADVERGNLVDVLREIKAAGKHGGSVRRASRLTCRR